jgi:hypothetical protein
MTQMAQINTEKKMDGTKRDEQTYVVLGAPRLEFKRLVFHLRSAASSADQP